MKLYIEGFRGPWGWVGDYEKVSKFDIVSNADEADVIFQCDPGNWRLNERHLERKIVIANVLDFSEWLGGNPEIENYVQSFCKRATKVTAISKKVIYQLKERGIDAGMFYYPSQVSSEMVDDLRGIPRKNRIISFCRLGDPGKKLDVAAKAFIDSDFEKAGWLYWLCGPESPIIPKHKQIKVMGYMPKEVLVASIASSKLTIMPSIGEGLGLPAIESTLLNTWSMVRSIEPMVDVFQGTAKYFSDDDHLLKALNDVYGLICGSSYPSIGDHQLDMWKRDVAFGEFERLIVGVYNDYRS